MFKTKILFAFGIVLSILVFFAFLVPALQRPKVNPRYNGSLSNLKSIGVALWMYAEDHNDIFPENSEQLEAFIKMPHIFNSPLKPRDFNGPSYIYVSGHSFKDVKSKQKYIIVYENPEYLSGYEREKINVLYLYGYVERFKKEDFLSKLKATYEHLGKTMPEIKFKE